MSKKHVLEVAVFKVKDEFVKDIPELRKQLIKDLENYPGLQEFYGYLPISDNMFADIVKWDSLEAAEAAAKAFEQGAPEFLPYMKAIESLEFMGHFDSK
jgi:heme-degrading monooxygenase HmoA